MERKGLLDFVELAKKFPEYHFLWFDKFNKYENNYEQEYNNPRINF